MSRQRSVSDDDLCGSGSSQEVLSAAAPPPLKCDKVITAESAAALVQDGATLVIGGFVGAAHPEELVLALAAAPKSGIRLVFGVAHGDARGRGLDVLAAVPGLVGSVVSAHNGVAPRLQQLFAANACAAYNIPLGTLSSLFRDIAAGRPGHVTTVGLGTFVDPRHGGCCLNDRAREETPVVELTHLGGAECLFFKTFPVHVAFLRGSTADCRGNISMENEAVVLDALHMAMAAHNSGGVVVVQVAKLSAAPLDSRSVVIPGVLVDHLVLSSPLHHQQTFASAVDDSSLSGRQRKPLSEVKPLPLDHVKVICRRASTELRAGTLVNLGLGIPERVAIVLNEHGHSDKVTMTAEAGVIGGVPANGLLFGTAYNTDVCLPTSALFDLYDGGGLDLSCLGMAEVDETGSVNVGHFSSRWPGLGGFTNISQNAKRLLFLGTFTAGDFHTDIKGGGTAAEERARLTIVREGRHRKFVERVQSLSFSGPQAVRRGACVTYITERAVFTLSAATGGRMELIELAPGIDLQSDVLDNMSFTPLIRRRPIPSMDPRLFTESGFDLQQFDAHA